MEIYAAAAMTKMGQTLQQQRNSFVPNSKPTDPRPSMNNIYDSKYYDTVREDELTRGTANWKAAQDPWRSGTVPKPAYASMFTPLSAGLESAQAPAPVNQSPVSTMAGIAMSREDFTHNNMQPYFRGSLRQNIDPGATSSTLQSYTGRSDLQQRKQAVECLFEPTPGFSHVCGFAPSSVEFQKERVSPFTRRANDFPIEQVRVGPGLGLGYTAEGQGGYQQASSIDYVMPKTVDELRTASNPKLVMENKSPQGPQKSQVTQRGMIGAVDKNRPDTYYEQTPDMLLRTTAANLKDTLQPEQMVKATSRVDTHVEYQGSSQAFSSSPGTGIATDYGKESIMVYNNERDITGPKTVLTNLTSLVKAVVSPLLDVFRHNLKEYTIDSARIFGSMQAQIPAKPTTYDPVNHMMKTTIKEQTIHDTTIMNPRGKDAVPVESEDIAKTTLRETLPAEETTRNIAAHKYNVTVYDIDSVMKTTIRQTTDQSASMYGFMSGDASAKPAGAYSVIDVEMPLTQKQFVSDYEYEGVSESKADFRQMSHEATDNAEIDGTREALHIASGNTPGGGGAYIGITKEQIEMDSKRIMQDSITTRETGNKRDVQFTARAIDNCEITRQVARELDNPQVGRYDSSLVSALAGNPYSIPPLNPPKY